LNSLLSFVINVTVQKSLMIMTNRAYKHQNNNKKNNTKILPKF
jgi:hypothetical protein